jgi:hypothetical protein
MKNKETLEELKGLAYYKANAEEDYLQVPISVLRYISQLEQEQDKNKYSGKDMIEFAYKYLEQKRDKVSRSLNPEELLEQFKNK